MKKVSARLLVALLILENYDDDITSVDISKTRPRPVAKNATNSYVLPIGCFKVDLISSYIEVSGNYPYFVNLTGIECVRLCFSSSRGYKLAALSANGICLCSLVNINQSQEKSNVSCLFPSTEGFYFKLYSIPALANISVPEPVLLFQEFRVNISTINDTSCSYLLNFDDGRKVSITTNNNSVSHVYKSNGNFEVKLTSTCLPEAITEAISVKIPLRNASLDCPEILELTQTNSSCILKVLQGSEINTTLNSSFLGTMPDTTVQSAGIPSSWFYNDKTFYPPPNETALYIWPFTAINHEGVITAFELYVNRTGNLTIQIYSPECPQNTVRCGGGCVASYALCSEPNISGEFMNTSYCHPDSSQRRNVNFANYTVRSELSIDISSTGYTLRQLSPPLPIQRYDLLGWKSSPDSALIHFANLTSSWEWSDEDFTLNQSFSLPLIPQLSPKSPYFRIHFFTTSIFENSLKPVTPKLVLNITVSGSISNVEELSEEITVQERISGLEILSPNGTNDYFPTNEILTFRFEVKSGSEVRYHVDPGDSSNSSNINIRRGDSSNSSNSSNINIGHWNHSYERKANISLNVTAFNRINSVSSIKNLSLVNSIRDLSFVNDPKDKPGLIGVPYPVEFRLGAGDGARFQVDFKPDMSLFLLPCEDFKRNESITFNISYENASTYPIAITAFSKYLLYSNDSINSTVTIKEEVRNLSLLEIVDDEVPKPLNKNITHMAGKPLVIRAIVATGAPVEYEFNISQSDGGSRNSFIPHDGQKKFEFNRCEIGDWVITVTASNGASSKSENISVKVIKECGVEILAGRKEKDPFVINSGVDLEIKVERIPPSKDEENCIDDESSESCCILDWTLEKKENNAFKRFFVHSTSDQNSFLVKRSTLPDGLYKIQMYTQCEDEKRLDYKGYKPEETYVKVESSNPVAKIIGGSTRDVANKSDGYLVLDGTTSYDPDGTHFNSSSLSFNWSCSPPNSLELNESVKVQHINITKLTSKKYIFKLEVVRCLNNCSGESKRGSATQTIHVVDASIPTTEIICKVNCLPVVVKTERFALEGGSKGNHDVQFHWSLEEEDNTAWKNTSYTGNDTYTLTGWDKSNLVLKPNVLNESRSYRLKLRARKHDTVGGSLTIYKFLTSGAPISGNCSINPTEGDSDTEFQVLCKDWKAEYFPLTYLISYSISVGKRDASILWYHGYEQTSPRSKFPPGQNENNYTLNVSVRIQEKYGGYTTRNLTVQVNPTSSLTTEEFKEAFSKLGKNAKKEPQKLTQLVTIYSTTLNNDDSKIPVEERKQLRLRLVELLAKLDATTLPLVKQTADAVRLTVLKAKQVTQPTQDSAVTTLNKLSLRLHKIAIDPSQRSFQDIEETAGILFSATSLFFDVNNVLSADVSKTDARNKIEPNVYGTASKAGQQLNKVGLEMKKVVMELDQVISNVSLAILGKKLVGETPTTLNTENFDMELSNNLAKDDEAIVQYVNDDIKVFRLPPTEMLFNSSGKYHNIYTRFLEYKRNPYVWDINKSAFIQPNLLSLSFTTERNEPIPVRNLCKDIEISLSNNISQIKLQLLTPSKGDARFLIYTFRVRDLDFQDTILIDVEKESGCSLSEARFFVRFGKTVSPTSFDSRRYLSISTNCNSTNSHSTNSNCTDSNSTNSNSTNSHSTNSTSYIEIHGSRIFLRDPKKLTSGQGIVSIGILPCSAEVNSYSKSDANFSLNKYKVYVRSVSCRYWNPAKSKWNGDGCSVGPCSTQNRTQCFCNHLTSFSSYIVKPNPLAKFSTEAFREGYALFVAVILVFLLYFLILIWARKADRADVTKVGVCALSDNSPRDRYRYEIAVWTGMRRNAGTESEVSVILSGDNSDSEPRRLVNPNRKGLKRGSLEKFLLTTPEDLGGLYCIRISHDNSKGSWYLSRVMVTDLENDEQYYFICDRWLAVDEDNGAIERLLPVASDEELTDFYHLFYSRTKRNLSDTHLWVSVLNRPPHSMFTRVQRLSCCLCVLVMTMAANAMFYERKSKPKPDSTNFIGSYSFTWDEIFIGVVCSLIIFPANMIILYIFRHVRPKSVKPSRQSDIALISRSLDYKNILSKPSLAPSVETIKSFSPVDEDKISITTDGNTPLVPERKKKKTIKKTTRCSRIKECLPRPPSSLPHCFVYFAWFLIVVLILGSATVVILYGMQFGNGRSLQWLFSIIVSICEDIFVLQPLKVLVLALAFALLVRKPDEGEFSVSRDGVLQDDEEFLLSAAPSPIAEQKVRSPKMVLRPDEHQLKAMRRRRMKERKMFGLIQEIIVHLFYIIVVYLVTYGHKDTRAINLSQHLNGSLSQYNENDTVYEIKDFPHLWNWSRVTLIPVMLPDEDSIPSAGFFEDGYNYMISRARLRLLRVAKDPCPIPKEFKSVSNVCGKDYSIFDQDEASYGKGWQNSTRTKGRIKSAWDFQSWRNLDGYPTWGFFTTYSGSGYVTELVPGKDNNATVTEMEKLDWLDKQSRALFIELTTYNANVNLYTSIMLLFEFPSYGGIVLSRHIEPMRLKVYVGGFAFFIFACEVVFLIFTAAYLYIALKKIYHNGLSYLKTFWNFIDLGIVLASLAAIGVYIYRIGLTTKLMHRVTHLDGSFVNFQYVTYWNEVYNCVIAFVVAFATLKLTKLLRFNMRISLFGKTLKHARPALMLFSVQFGIVFIAYLMVGVLVFGSNEARFKSISTGIMSLLRVILGKSAFTELFDINPVIGPLFFFTFVFFISWVLVNMFLAILNDAYHEVQLNCGAMANEYEMMDFFLAKFRAWAGLGRAEESFDPKRRWQKANMKVKAAKELGRRHGYQPSAEDVELEKTSDLMERFEDAISRLEKRVHLLAQDD